MPILTSLALGAARGFGFGISTSGTTDVVNIFTSGRSFII